MMAKMFYTLDEAKAALGKSEEEIKEFTRDGRLREFRDGPRLMFKADQVEALKKDLGGAGVDISPSDSAIPIAPGEGRSGSGVGMTLAEDTGSGRSPGAALTIKDEGSLAQELGLSGTVGGVPSPARPSGSGSGLSSATGSKAGVDVFHGDEVDKADPGAQTVITKGAGDRVSMEGVGSGSGLLDLTRESDDTSLGAELLDEIAPGATPKKIGMEPAVSGALLTEVLVPTPVAPAPTPVLATPVYVEAPDPWALAFGATALAAALAVFFGAFVLISTIAGVQPQVVKDLAQKGLITIALWGLGITLLFGIVGFIIGKVTSK